MRPYSFGLTALLWAWLSLLSAPTHASGPVAARTDFGKTQVAAMTSRYEATPDNCGGADAPAFVCSGVMIRSTGSGVGYHVWDPSPAAITLDGTSFSYLRADANFAGFGLLETWAGHDGLIFSPAMHADVATFHPAVRCAFPLDGWTRTRVMACGESTQGGAGSRPCQQQNIYTAEAWRDHFYAAPAPANAGYKQCGFATADVADAASAFLASVKARAFITSEQFEIHNELVVKTWPANMGAKLPIEAFFYIVKGEDSGLAGAQRNQKDLLNSAGVAVPVIRVNLPSNAAGRATFTYATGDQAILYPSLPATLDVPPAVSQAPAGRLALPDILSRQDIEVTVPSSALPGDTGRVRWVGASTYYETPAQRLATDGPTIFRVPRGVVLATLGQSVAVSFVVVSATPDATERASVPLTVAVDPAAGALPPPVLAADGSSMRIDYPAMAGTDQIWATYEGKGIHDTPYPKRTAPFNAAIPSEWRGTPERAYYRVVRSGRHLVSGVVTPVSSTWPVVHEATNGWLDLAALPADPSVTLPPWQGIAIGQTVWLDALGYMPDGSEQRSPLLNAVPIGDTAVAQGVRATLARTWLSRLPDGSEVFLRARVTLSPNDPASTAYFPIARFTVRGAPVPMVTKPYPRLVELLADGTVASIDGLFSPSAARGQVQVRVAPWFGRQEGQRFWLRIRGRKPDGQEIVVDLANNEAVTTGQLSNGIVKGVPATAFAAFADGSQFIVECKVGYEKLTEEARALRLPINHLTYRK